MTALPLARLLVRFRWRSLWNGAWRVPRQRSMRIAWGLVLLAPVAYVGLFTTAFGEIAARASLGHQIAVLALVVGAVVLASATAKMAGSEAVVGGSGENEFLLARPVALPTLVMARSLAGAATDLFDALFLFPVLVSAALVWELGLAGVLYALVISVIVQVGVSAAAQTGQILVVRLVPPARRRLVWSAMALLAALTMACLWMVASWVLRRPEVLVDGIGPWSGALWLSPGGFIVAPLAALARGAVGGSLLAFAAPLELTVLALLAARVVVAWAGRAGWEQAGTPWAEAARGPGGPGARMTPFTKDWYLILRDRSRLVTLVAVPVIFIGIQLFGSAGWSWSTGTAHHIAILAYSLAAYMAGFGPLMHMESERRAFWLLRVAPLPLGHLLAWKAAFWSAIVGGMAALVSFGLLLASDVPLTADAFGLAALAVVGAVLASCLAVAMASGVADFSDDTRKALGPGTLYLFLLVASLFNVALYQSGEVRVRALALYAAAVGLHWISGVEGAAKVFDPESHRQKRVVAGDGAVLCILLFLGTQVQRLADVPPVVVLVAWPALLIAVSGAYLWRRRPGSVGPSRRSLVANLLLAGAVVAEIAWLGKLDASGMAVATAVIVRALAEELIVRGVIQQALAPHGRWLAFGVSVAMALLASGRPLGVVALAMAVVPAAVLALSGRLKVAIAARLGLHLFT